MAHRLKDDYDGAYNRSTLELERQFFMEKWGEFCLCEWATENGSTKKLLRSNFFIQQ